MDSPRVFQYWNARKMPPYLQLCHESVLKHHKNVTLFNETDLKAALWSIGIKVPVTDRKQTDANIFRAYLLHHFGGIWLDMDILCFKSFEPIYEKLEGFAVVRSSRSGDIDNNILMAKSGSEIAKRFWSGIAELLKSKKIIGSAAQVGITPLKKLLGLEVLTELPSQKFAWGDITIDWLEEGEMNIPDVHAIHLCNNLNHSILADKSRDWLLRANMFYIQQVFRKALDV